MVAILAVVSNASAANVVQRNTVSTSNRVSATRPTAASSRMPTMSVNVTATSSQSETPATTDAVESATTTTAAETITVENKSSQFGSGLTSGSKTEIDTAAMNLAELVRAQRAALDSADAAAAITAQSTNTNGTGENACDTALRECMTQQCGSGFARCAGDTDTIFGDKMDTCRRGTNCTGREYQLFSTEIKADRDLNAKLAGYNATVSCGNNYDTCIVGVCGANYSKCIGKSAGDTAIAKCDSIAKSCVEYDSGLAMRAMAIFGELRGAAERQIATDEQKLYTLRERMRSVCTRLGAMFDERSLDCVYTVNFYADSNGTDTLFASKKLYAGSVFDCTPNWFGIDVTTYRENALRATREQSAASSAMVGSGLGQLTGAVTSGAINRAIDRFNAENALNAAIEDCIKNGVDANGEKMTEAACRAKIGTTASDDKKDKSGGAKGAEVVSKALSGAGTIVSAGGAGGSGGGSGSGGAVTPESPTTPTLSEEQAKAERTKNCKNTRKDIEEGLTIDMLTNCAKPIFESQKVTLSDTIANKLSEFITKSKELDENVETGSGITNWTVRNAGYEIKFYYKSLTCSDKQTEDFKKLNDALGEDVFCKDEKGCATFCTDTVSNACECSFFVIPDTTNTAESQKKSTNTPPKVSTATSGDRVATNPTAFQPMDTNKAIGQIDSVLTNFNQPPQYPSLMGAASTFNPAGPKQ